MNCWKKHGAPEIDSPEIRRAAELCRKVDGFGNLHILVEDFNCEDNHIRSGRKYVEENEREANPVELEWEKELISLFESMTVQERASALALADRFWEPKVPILYRRE